MLRGSRARRRGLEAAATDAEEALSRVVAHARGVAQEARTLVQAALSVEVGFGAEVECLERKETRAR